MGKQTIQEVAKILVEKNGLAPKDANRFATEFFNLIMQRLQQGDQVKVKGLGTFKIINVEARESVSVRTGERVVIDSNSKVTFTPDAVMKELVNRPFAQFDTVILNEGVSFDETLLNDDDEETEAEPETTIEELVVQPVEEPVVQPVVEPVVEASVTQVVKEPEPVAPVEEPEEDKKPTEESAGGYVEKSHEEPEQELAEEGQSSRWWLWLLLAIIACAASFVAGYLFGRASSVSTVVYEVKPVPVVLSDTIAAPVPADTLAKDTAKVDTMKQVPAPAEDGEWQKYDTIDNRVRLGAYRIIGTDQIIKARKGDTSKRIARRTLGEGMECYIEVYNGISGRDTLKAGQEVKLPKLESKKKLSSKKTNKNGRKH